MENKTEENQNKKNPIKKDKHPEILEDYLNYIRVVKGLSPLTVKEYAYDLSLFLKYIKFINSDLDENIEDVEFKTDDKSLLESVSPRDLYSYMAYLGDGLGNSSRTIGRNLSSIRQFFDYLTNKIQLIDNNPMAQVDSPKIAKTQPVYLTLDESRRLLDRIHSETNDFIRTRDYAMVMLFLNLGLRLAELRAIDILDIKDRTLRVTGKGNKERIVFLNDACIRAINEYLKERPYLEDEDALFLSNRNNRISRRAIQYRIEHYIKEIGLDPSRYSVHKLRHTAATLMYTYGDADIRALQAILGHESIATTELYTHVNDKIVQETLNMNPLNEL